MLIIPGIAVPGIIAYIAVEIIPELMRSRTAQRTARGFKKALDPGRDLRRYENEARVGGNVASRQRYAEELVRHGRYDDAIAQYRAGAHRPLRARPEPHARARAGAVRQGRRRGGACHAR